MTKRKKQDKSDFNLQKGDEGKKKEKVFSDDEVDTSHLSDERHHKLAPHSRPFLKKRRRSYFFIR